MLMRFLKACLVISTVFCYNAHSEQKIVTKSDLTKAIDEASNKLEENGAKTVIEDYSDAVVLIHTISNKAEDDGLIYNSAVKKRLKKHHYMHGVVSGVMLSKDGIICTTNNGIMNSDEIIVSINSELKSAVDDNKVTLGENDYRAKIIKTIPELNLAFLKIQPKEGKTFSNIKLGNDAALINGKDKLLLNGAVVIGKAKGENFVTKSKPANSKNNFTMFATGVEKLVYRKSNGMPVLLIENSVTNSGVIPENEGGAVLDMYGNLLGIATVNYDDFSFISSTAIPVSVIKQGAKIAVPTLISNSDNARIGINVIDSKNFEIPSNLRKTLGVSGKLKVHGAFVESTNLRSVADSAGIQHGDLILKFNEDIVTDAKTYENLENSSIGEQTISLKILRGKNLLDIEIDR